MVKKLTIVCRASLAPIWGAQHTRICTHTYINIDILLSQQQLPLDITLGIVVARFSVQNITTTINERFDTDFVFNTKSSPTCDPTRTYMYKHTLMLRRVREWVYENMWHGLAHVINGMGKLILKILGLR